MLFFLSAIDGQALVGDTRAHDAGIPFDHHLELHLIADYYKKALCFIAALMIADNQFLHYLISIALSPGCTKRNENIAGQSRCPFCILIGFSCCIINVIWALAYRERYVSVAVNDDSLCARIGAGIKVKIITAALNRYLYSGSAAISRFFAQYTPSLFLQLSVKEARHRFKPVKINEWLLVIDPLDNIVRFDQTELTAGSDFQAIVIPFGQNGQYTADFVLFM